MAILTIIRMGNPVLAQLACPVEDPTAPEIEALARDMVETLGQTAGVGLAAPQVGQSLRLVVFKVPETRSDPVPLTVLINPEIEPLGEDMQAAYEGCLSVPGLTGVVPRWSRIRYRGVGLDGAIIEREAEGFHARLVQHECDHLDGRLYLSRMTDLTSLGYIEELFRPQPPQESVP